MTEAEKQSSNFTTGKLLIDFLAEDGVICNALNKEYDEQATYEGGLGNRQRFTIANEKIIAYHQLLKILNGEWRANIHEAIPAIDFLNRGNTSIMNTYLVEDGRVHADTITPIPASISGVLQDIINDDPYTINRAVTGGEVAEYFYNSTGAMSEANCLVSPPSESLANFAYIYKGIQNTVETIYDADGESTVSAAIRLDKVLWIAPKIGETCTVNYDSDIIEPTEPVRDSWGNSGSVDDQGTLILQEGFLDAHEGNFFVAEGTSALTGGTALTQLISSQLPSDKKGLSISLINGDFCIIIPGSLTSLEPTRIIVAKRDVADNGYGYFIAYATSVSYAADAILLDPDDSFPNLPDSSEEGRPLSTAAVEFLSKYLAIEKEFYSNASGLLCGAFSEPKEYTNLGSNRIVEKWKYVNDADEAAKRHTSVPIGSKLYPNYLLGRGTIMDAPLATCETYTENGVPKNYNGLATYLFDNMGKQFVDIYKKYETDLETWNDHPDYVLGGVLTKEDWSSPSPSVANPLKFKISNKQFVGFDEIEGYISRAINSLKPNGDGTYTVRLSRNDPSLECCYRNDQNTGIFDWGWSRTKSAWQGNGANGNTLASDYSHIYRLQWTVRLKKGGNIIDSCRNLSMKVMSPFQAFRPYAYSQLELANLALNLPSVLNNPLDSSLEPYLLWPSEKSYFPPKLLLLSITPLGVTPGENGNNTICFYNDTEDSAIMFEVTSALEFPASKITRVEWFNEPCNKYESRDISVDNAAAHDCYVYTLEHPSVDLTEIDFKDRTGNIVASIPYFRASIVPLSSPKDYFECKIARSADGSFHYTLSDLAAKRSLGTLNQSTIISGMPLISKLTSNDVTGIPDHKIPAFRGIQKLFSAGGTYDTSVNSLIKDSLYTTLYNRPVSEKTDISSTGELIVLGELPELIEGLETLPDYFEEVIKAGIVVNNKKLTTYDFEDFYNRLYTHESFKAYPDFALSYTPISTDTMIDGKPLRDYIDSLLPIGPGKFSADVVNTAFRTTIEKVVNQSIKFVNTGTSTPFKSRPSLISLANTLRHIFSTSANANITRNDCETLDSYFGNDTKAFLVTREDPDADVVPEAAVALIENTVDAYAEIISDVDKIFKSVAKEKETTAYIRKLAPVAYETFETNITQLRTEIQQIYEKYFKSSSIKIYGTIKPTVDTDALRINPEKVKADFDALRNDPNRYVRYQYGWSWGYDYSTSGNIFVRLARGVANTAFYAAFRFTFGKSAWNTCDTVMREWPSMSLNAFIDRYKLNASTTAGLSKANARIHNYILDTVTASRKASVKAEASRETDAKVQQLIAQQEELNNAKKKATKYADNVYRELTKSPLSDTLNKDVLKWSTKAKLLFGYSTKKYIEGWLEGGHIQDTQATRYSKIDGVYTPASNGAYIKDSDIKSQYASYYSDLLTEDGYLQGNQRSITLELPHYSKKKSKLTASGSKITFDFPPYRVEKVDISNNLLEGVATYVRTALEGTSSSGTNDYFVRFEPGDSNVTGRFNSLYYERYLYLNARLNKSTGTLYRAAQFDKSGKIFTTNNAIEDQLKRLNKKYFTSIPVEWASELSYFKPQMLEKMNTFFPGKFYYKRQLLDIARQINDKCMLTCGYCPVKDTCPFYGEDEVLKMACTSAPSIDLYVKDNEPDLLYYSEGTATQVDGRTEVVGRSPAVYYEEDGNKEELSHELLQSYSHPYASVAKKTAATRSSNGELIYESDLSGMYRDLTKLEEETRRAIGGLDFKTEVPSGLGWLTGGRWGTFQKNRLADGTSGMSSPDYPAKNFPHNKYFYDAVFLNDEETEVLYAPSQNWYDVEVSTAETADSDGTPKTYKGKTRIKIPVALKAFAERPTGDVYLVSDDKVDDQGNPITPVIYLGKVGDVRYAFDLREEGGNQDEVTSSSDTRIYPKDVAQWSINVAKGNCLHDRIDPDAFTKNNNIGSDALSHGYDQYWMENLKKRVVVNGEERILDLPGRVRRNAGYSEVVVDPDNMNEYEVISGKPVAANRINFMRRISFRIYDDNAASATSDGYTMIPWCKEPGDPSKVTADSLYVDTQKSVLPFMKTNLRLVICEVER